MGWGGEQKVNSSLKFKALQQNHLWDVCKSPFNVAFVLQLWKMALFPQGGKSVSRSHASVDASSSVPPCLPRWRLLLAHTSLPVQDYNGNPSCLLAPKFLTHRGFPASPPCLVAASGLATRLTWTQSLLRLLAGILWWCLLKSLPRSLSVWFLLPFTFQCHCCLYFLQNGSQRQATAVQG